MNIQAQDERLQTRTPHVLIVEDDEDARSIYSDYLSRHGYHTLTAASGEQALALAQTHPLDLALLDIMMPGMSGREVAAWLRKNRPEVEIVFVTRMFVIRAHDKVDVAVEEMHRGAFYYLSKPVRLRQLLEIVEQALAKRQARALVGAQVRSGDLLVDLQRGQATL
ncbi:MAG TPA: response regulator, partial [Chloroflexi bacterium]|nr:response regulator [Chloroflexota bacterium]